MNIMDGDIPPTSKIKEYLQIQLDELESLQSMFCNPGEIRVDLQSLQETQEFVARGYNFLPSTQLDYTINIEIDKTKFEICVNLPYEYPDVTPEIFLRNSILSKTQHVALHKDINSFLNSLDKGEPCIFSAVSWLQDNYEKYIEIKQEEEISNDVNNETIIRYWIYAHHIYNKTKRREILDQAHNYNLKGFCLPGKPGIICVEGPGDDCEGWWQIIKSMNWKKIYCKCTEENKEGDENFKKFTSFQEITFPTTGQVTNHSDMKEFNKYLEKQSLGYMFKELFGLEDKSGDK